MSGLSDAEMLEQFEARTLPFGQWTHRAHVKVGYLYVREHGFAGALSRMRSGIKAYNAVNADQVRTGYHETITIAFLRLIAASVVDGGASRTAAARPPDTADGFCDAHPELLDQTVLRRFYAPRTLQSGRARSEWVEPDRMSLPALEPRDPA